AAQLGIESVPDLDSLLPRCDFLTVHVPGGPETRDMIGAAQLAKLPKGARVINCARGGIYNEQALADALRSGHLAGAGLDHFEGEHLAADHPLAGMHNVVLTPHIGGATYDTEANHSKLIADDVARILRGDKPVNCVNPEVLS
ncbi:MAG TPA: NAD(P)-dependent oxidoreductase, partial [Acidimicrobiia bacterium]|nr:NAD(P)-dependent oxidoreductase [Acidimicrobiia bacterium]